MDPSSVVVIERQLLPAAATTASVLMENDIDRNNVICY